MLPTPRPARSFSPSSRLAVPILSSSDPFDAGEVADLPGRDGARERQRSGPEYGGSREQAERQPAKRIERRLGRLVQAQQAGVVVPARRWPSGRAS